MRAIFLFLFLLSSCGISFYQYVRQIKVVKAVNIPIDKVDFSYIEHRGRTFMKGSVEPPARSESEARLNSELFTGDVILQKNKESVKGKGIFAKIAKKDDFRYVKLYGQKNHIIECYIRNLHGKCFFRETDIYFEFILPINHFYERLYDVF